MAIDRIGKGRCCFSPAQVALRPPPAPSCDGDDPKDRRRASADRLAFCDLALKLNSTEDVKRCCYKQLLNVQRETSPARKQREKFSVFCNSSSNRLNESNSMKLVSVNK